MCPSVEAAWSVYEFHTGHPISVMWDNFSNDSCLPNPSYPCSPAGYPPYVVNATTAEHVKLGIDFGHDYLGRSIAPGALSIWTHNIRDITYHKDEFMPDGCDVSISGSALTAGGGVQVYDAYLAAAKYNHTIVGGGGKSVGLGGYITGGGHSILSAKHGLAADQVLQAEIVTPKGDIVTANECQNQDLFWAIRGGGGGTFGVLTSITLTTYPSPKIVSFTVMLGTAADAPFLWDIITLAFSRLPTWGDAGLSGYFFSSARTPSPLPITGGPKEVGGLMGITILQDQEPDAMLELFGALNETLQERWPGMVFFYAQEQHFDSFIDWYDVYYDQGTAGNSTYLGSRLLPKDVLEGDQDALKSALETAGGPTGGLSAFLVAGKGVANAKPRGGGNAVHPAWRKALIKLAVGSMGFPPFNKTAESEAIETLTTHFEPLRQLTPDGGSYVNEALKYEPNFQQAFWGKHYERLAQIKRKFDSDDLFWCQPCIGNERWEERDDGRLCRK
ncbi:hypothetical protein D7B24_001763 [Verticillium nonalfalfae]|uniref:FAD-binding PCMH-type domain-containing protein n=1 Tax=Verticillium nonalfalfae TaxID=1051616 RepID=A0A3M9XZP6_9PEZI|nr:uncharacterized protein D7B24_001763 [Verticillium nonalfalfae]RNJ53474.1 hypothetical protein D7B24_001763 [Verticillium nonalfalfae]